MKQKSTVALFQYWDRLRSGRTAPKRTEIEPADIKTMLADTFILERDLRGDAVFRLAGTRLCAAFGRELKGFAFASLFGHADQGMAAELARGGFARKAVSVAIVQGMTRQGRTLDFELLLLPLDSGSESPRALGSICPFDKPFWLGADPVVECAIATTRVIDPAREAAFLPTEAVLAAPPLVPSDENLASQEGARRRRFRHLVVIDGGRGE